ncbi:DHH family phosphoesterase [Desulfofustis limnaeus]|jgi:phosphoesterase RecJ-like protein|uniref:Phosphoesterase n=1 Tax=Desulfofustis limnaeus TaxID=2740163 RepID=A0ABM7WA68_9BACT|nr:bifunctional oligoribonuclease/PAP phosphatase NrnA [Desulfofustis limnaeus]MDX9894441.1 bifunctional oligoribonuclease/PAP phosphatase NrnA [Desulfofustis sp.]BDD87788.1 phosphoesterase [Desulfofustis limnaeus]
MNVNTVPEQILDVFREKGHFLILTHIHPDGDALGSQLGLADILTQRGKEVLCYLDAPVSHLYDFLPGAERVCCSKADVKRFCSQAGSDLATVVLDCGEADRLGREKEVLTAVKPVLVVDHHRSHRSFGDICWVDPARSSTGEMVYEIGEALGHTFSPEAAFNIYVAIATDTGSFRYENTGSRTLEIAARLVDGGVHPEQVSVHIHENFSPARMRLLRMVLETLDLHENDQIACIHVTGDMLAASGATIHDIEGFVDFPRSIRSVRVAFFLKAVEGKEKVSVSLRAKGTVDVAEIAKAFAGGGHRNAAGCRFSGVSIEEVRRTLIRAIIEQMAANLAHP